MSNSLVRASFDLFGYEDDSKRDKKERKNRSKRALDLIPIGHRVIGKTSKKEAITLKRSQKVTVEEAKKRLECTEDKTRENIRKLLLLSGHKLDAEVAGKLVKRVQKKSATSEKGKKSEAESTVFTEEDFEKFEKEYDEL